MIPSNISAGPSGGPASRSAARPSRSSWRCIGALALLWLLPAVPGAFAENGTDPAPVPGPRLEVESEKFDLGQVNRGASVEAQFKLKNVGSEPLRILKVKPG